LLADAVDVQIEVLGLVTDMVTGDAGSYSRALENAVFTKRVKLVAAPNRSARSIERKKKEHGRWFGSAQRWRTGCEGPHQRRTEASACPEPLQLSPENTLTWVGTHMRETGC